MKTRVAWSSQDVEAVKTSVKAEIDKSAGESTKERMLYALRRVRETEQDETPAGRLRCLIYIVTALVHHRRRSGMTLNQVQGLVTRAYAILQTQGVASVSSQLAFLYGEVHQAASLIYMQAGLPWRSAWEQQVAAHVSGRNPIGGEAFQSLSLAHRAFRLGNASLAFNHFLTAEKLGLGGRLLYQARIERIRCLRLGGQSKEALASILKAYTSPDLPAAMRQELEWERKALAAHGSGDLAPLVVAVRKGGSHHHVSYVLETFLWTKAAMSKEFSVRLPKISSIKRSKAVDVRSGGFLMEVCLVLEQCYDTAIPLAVRVKKLGEILGNVSSLRSIDKELLVWAAAARWLNRIRSFVLAALALREYEGQCRWLSDFRESDVFGLMGDLMAKDWFAKARWQVDELPHAM